MEFDELEITRHQIIDPSCCSQALSYHSHHIVCYVLLLSLSNHLSCHVIFVSRSNQVVFTIVILAHVIACGLSYFYAKTGQKI